MLRCASSFVIAAYAKVRLIPQDSRALPAVFLRSRPFFATFKTFYEVVMIDQNFFNRVVRCIETYEQEMIRLQIGLCAIPALAPENGGDGEHRKAAFLKSYLREAGFSHVGEINAPDDRVSSGVRPNLIVRIPGKNTEKTVWVLTHMDIVPPGELSLWREDPYRGYISEGKLFGRGMEDNQQDLVASLFAVGEM